MLSFVKKTWILAYALLFAPLCACNGSSTPPQPIPPPADTVSPSETPVQPTTDGTWDVSDVDVSQIDPTKKLIAFTFDDAPSGGLEQLVGAFAHYNAENPDCPAYATLFCNGVYVNEFTLPALQTAYLLSFELGNHTHSHKDLTALTTDELQREIDLTDALLERLDGKPFHLLRAPYGKIDERFKRIANAPIFDWYVDTLDWTGRSVDEIYDSVFSQKSDGAVVLFHDGYENTVAAVKRLLPDLKGAGYQVVGVSQMAKAHNLTLKNGGVYTRARKPKSIK